MNRYRLSRISLATGLGGLALIVGGGIVFAAAGGEGATSEFEEAMEWAEDDIDGYWERVADSYGLEYEAPKRVSYYVGEEDTPCGETMPNNAFYCPEDHSIYADEAFLETQAGELGEYSAVYILAHEWGHLAQDDLGILDSRNLSIQVELQADCFAGAYTQDLEWRNETFSAEDLAAAVRTLTQVGDPERYPWLAPGAHGDSEQRVEAFNVGYEGGFEACVEPPFAQER